MNKKRIKEIQEETAYPDSISVQQALLKVWNECEQEKLVKNNAVLPLVSNRRELLFAFEEYWSSNNCDGDNFADVVDRFLANNSC
jgi:hypothetical protein